MPELKEETAQNVVNYVDGLKEQLVKFRRDFHMHPELGFLEYRTTSLIVSELREAGYEVLTGKDACKEDARMGLPSEEDDKAAIARAIEEGADAEFVKSIAGGHTGAVAIMRNGEGPVIGMRFDIDCLPLNETTAEGISPPTTASPPSTPRRCTPAATLPTSPWGSAWPRPWPRSRTSGPAP